MSTPVSDVRGLAQAGVEALRKGEHARARDQFGQIVAAGRADETVWIALATACKGLGDREGLLEAIDKALALAPRSLRGLIMKGDAYADGGDVRAATAFYQAALRFAPPPLQLPADLANELRRVQGVCERHAAEYAAFLQDTMASKGFVEGRSSGRFGRSLDLMLGKRQVFYQQPVFYYFPELPQIQFYERAKFPWIEAVEAATGDIRSELLEILKDEGAFTPYVEGLPNRPRKDYMGLLNNPDWSAFYLWKNGTIQEDNAARCPKTLAAMKSVPMPHIARRTPTVLFSLLRAKTRIPPHNGFINTRLICHLPLIVPEKCRFRVGNETREWKEGEVLVFDDTIQHEAFNDSDELRVILLFDIWRPELTDEERALVTGMFEAINEYGGEQPEWMD